MHRHSVEKARNVEEQCHQRHHENIEIPQALTSIASRSRHHKRIYAYSVPAGGKQHTERTADTGTYHVTVTSIRSGTS